MSQHVVILGTGLVSQPIIDYLFKETDYHLTVADIVEDNARKSLKGNPRGTAAALDVKDETGLFDLIKSSDIVVSLLPYTFHPVVASHCLAAGKSMVNASYVSEKIQTYDAPAREKGLLFLCEMGLDPGIDHMSAMRIIDQVREEGGQITEFVSVCGGLPAPEASNNPFKYKFSWSPRGVLMAGNSSARFTRGSQLVEIDEKELFKNIWGMTIGDMQFEAYPNRDSTPYETLYRLEGVKTLLRGTLRFKGWSQLIFALKSLHLLDEKPLELPDSFSPAELLAFLNNSRLNTIKKETAAQLSLAENSEPMLALEWLGLFDENPRTWQAKTPIDCLATMMSEKMSYQDGERDMVVLHHEFHVEFPDRLEAITSTLIDYGIPHGASSMARTVSLPVAIAVKLILSGKIDLSGVHIPVSKTIYEPVLNELEALDIIFKEIRKPVNNND